MRSTPLTATDEMLSRSAERLGSTRMVQALWEFTGPVAEAELEALRDRLDGGRLSRTALSDRFPPHRRRWASTPNREPLIVAADDESRGAAAWADAEIRRPLDERAGQLWRLSLRNGPASSLVSLVVPHHRSDGLGMFGAVQCGAHGPTGRAGTGDGTLRNAPSDLLGSLRDRGRAAAGWGRRTTRHVRRRPPGASDPPITTSDGRAGTEPRFFLSAWMSVRTDELRRCALAHRATVNSLFVTLTADLVRAATGLDDVVVGVPVSTRRGPEDPRANALVVVPVPGVGEGSDRPARQRALLRCALSGARSCRVTVPPEPVWHLLPWSLAARLTRGGAQQTDGVASNFGAAGVPLLRLGDRPARRVAVRSMNTPGVVPAKARLRVSLCLLEHDDLTEISVTAMPGRIGDADELARRATAALADVGLAAHRWM